MICNNLKNTFGDLPAMDMPTPKGYPEPQKGYVWVQQWGFNCSGGPMAMHFLRPALPGEKSVPHKQ